MVPQVRTLVWFVMSHKEVILDLLKQGLSKKQIVRQTGFSPWTVHKYTSSNGNELSQRVIELRLSGKSVSEVAKSIGVSKSTVSAILSRTPEFEAQKKEQIKLSAEKRRKPPREKTGRSKSRGENSIDFVNQWRLNSRKARRQWLLSLFNNKCQACGYDRCFEALHFHHVDPSEKSIVLTTKNTLLIDPKKLLEEAKKCVLVCGNCHIEIHSGYTDCPEQIDLSNAELPIDPVLPVDADVIETERTWIKNRLERIKTKHEPTAFPVDIKSVKCASIEKSKLSEILDKYHYIGDSGKSGKCFGFFSGENLIGVALLSSPVRKSEDQTIEISRFCLTQNDKNLGSKCLSLLVEEAKKLKVYTKIQSFAQSDIHTGTIYRAAGFIQHSQYDKPSYNYSGIHKKTVYERAKAFGFSEYEYAELFGLEKIMESSKIKFVKLL